MRIGFTLPRFAPLAHQPDQVARFAEAIEEQVGADSRWVGDRLLAPVEPTVGYGGGPRSRRSSTPSSTRSPC